MKLVSYCYGPRENPGRNVSVLHLVGEKVLINSVDEFQARRLAADFLGIPRLDAPHEIHYQCLDSEIANARNCD